jgi:SNF2 family DNA or RNA helicase
MILSGTPVQNNTLDVWSQYDFLDPAIFACNYYAFQMRYAFLGGFSGHDYLGPKNLDELTRKMHSIAYRVTKAECLDLSEQTFEDWPVELEERAAKLYRQIKAESVAELAGCGTVTAQIELVRLLRLQQLTGGFLTADNGTIQQVSHAKLDALAEIVETQCVDARKKLVVFSRFIPELDAIKKTVEEVLHKSDENGLSCVMIRGDVKTEIRGSLVERFQTDDRCRVFLGELDACAEGITLTAADTTVYYSVNFNLAKYQQSLSRTHRTGQRFACTYIHLVVPGTIDTRFMQVLNSKGDLAKMVVDDWQNYFD